MHGLNWDDLRMLLAVARTRRLAAAARALRVDHTTVARRINALEEAMNVRLVDRTTRGTSLTETGERLVLHAERMEAEILAASALSPDADLQVSGVVRLSTPEAFGTYLVAPHIVRLHARHPSLRLDLSPESQQVSLTNREADIAIMLRPPAAGPLVARRLADYRLGLYASHSYLKKHGPIVSSQLGRHPVTWYIDEQIALPDLRMLREISPEIQPVFRSTAVVAQHAAVAGGLGLGVLHLFVADQDPRLVRVLAEDIEIRRSYWLVMHQDQQRIPRIRAVADFLDSLCGEMREHF